MEKKGIIEIEKRKSYEAGFLAGQKFKGALPTRFSTTKNKRLLRIANAYKIRKEQRFKVVCEVEYRRKVKKETLQKIGERVGLTRERVRQILERYLS